MQPVFCPKILQMFKRVEQLSSQKNAANHKQIGMRRENKTETSRLYFAARVLTQA